MVFPQEVAHLLVEEGQRHSTKLLYMTNSNCTEDLNGIHNTIELILIENLPDIGLDLDFLTITMLQVEVINGNKRAPSYKTI